MQSSTVPKQEQSQAVQVRQHANLQNLNFGMNVKPIHCNIHPTIVPNVLDHYLRRPDGQKYVVGTMLGGVDDNLVDIQTCFSIPFSQDDFIMDLEYLQQMLQFHRKVNPKEGLIGLYVTVKQIDQNVVGLWRHFATLFQDKKNKAILPTPMIMLIDPTMEGHKLPIKMMSLLTAHYTQVFTECSFSIPMKEYEKTGLDVIFFGQEHYDTMAILQQRHDIAQEDMARLTQEQKLLSNKDLMLKNFTEVIQNLQEAESYIQDIIEGKVASDAELGRLLDDTMGQFSTDDMALLESLIESNFEDAMMVSSLSKLQRSQLRVSEKLNSIFAESITKFQSTSTTTRPKKDQNSK